MQPFDQFINQILWYRGNNALGFFALIVRNRIVSIISIRFRQWESNGWWSLHIRPPHYNTSARELKMEPIRPQQPFRKLSTNRGVLDVIIILKIKCVVEFLSIIISSYSHSIRVTDRRYCLVQVCC